MKIIKQISRPASALLLLTAGLALLLAGCMGGGQSTQTTLSTRTTQPQATSTVASVTTTASVEMNAEALSTFQSKDPFIQQALPPATTTTASGSSGPTTTGGSGNTTTTFHLTTTTFHLTTTTAHSGNTTTTHATSTTTTTAAHKHMLKILSVGDVGGSPAVTLQVDNSVYKDKHIGDVLSTSWGQIKILDLSTASKVATLLHGSETVVLAAGQQIFE